ncbi:MAG TPA: hypothetical protein DEZ08_02770 [Dehalococcoidia bacterium]|jgi:acryloyl-coenzyme A reductase|nr:hypothetical protein [Dehalococcoidia bacterium]
MRAGILHNLNIKNRTLTVEDCQIPQIGAQSILIRVAYCGFCHHDLSVWNGLLTRGVSKKIIMGHEISGIIEIVGKNVEDYKIGDRVITLLTDSCGQCFRCLSDNSYRCLEGKGIGHSIDGGFAEYVAVSENCVFKVDDGISLVNAAMIACPIGVIESAFLQLNKSYKTIVVSGATGGLGIHALQKARMLSDQVIALTRSSHNEDLLLSLGATDVVTYDPQDEVGFSEIIMGVTSDYGAELFVDTVGSIIFKESLKSMSQFGTLVTLGDIHGHTIDFHLSEVLFKDLKIFGFTGTTRKAIELAQQDILHGSIKPIIADIINLNDLNQAKNNMENSSTIGRILVNLHDVNR